MESEQEIDISQYPRFITFKRAEDQLIKNGFIRLKNGYFSMMHNVYDNTKTGHRAFVKRIDVNRWEIYTYKLH